MSSGDDYPFYTTIKKIGIGFNVFGDYRQESSTEEIFDWQIVPKEDQKIEGEWYQVPICAEVQPAPSTQDDHKTCESVEELSNAFAANANAQANVGAFKGEVHAAYSEESHSNVKNYFSFYHHYEETLYLQIGVVKDEYLREEFKKDAEQLLTKEDSSNVAAYGPFFDLWGTHYIKACRLGGQLDCDISLVQENATTHSEMTVFVKAEYNGAFVTGTVDANVTKSKNWSAYHSNRKTHVRSVGGENAPRAADFENPKEDKSVARFNAWVASIKKTPATVHFHLEGLWKLFHDPEKSQKIKSAFYTYVANLRSSVTVECRNTSCYMVIDGGSDIKSAEGVGINVVVTEPGDKTKPPLFQKWYPNSGDDMHYKAAALDLDVPEFHQKLVFVYTSTDKKVSDELPVEFVRVLTECGAGKFLSEWDVAPRGSIARYSLAGSLHDPLCRNFAIEALTINDKEPMKLHYYLAKDKYAGNAQPSFC